MAAMSMFSMADLPSVRETKGRRSKSSVGHSRPRSAAETVGSRGSLQDPGTVRALSAMKDKTDRLEALVRQARSERKAGNIRDVVREEVQRQPRGASGTTGRKAAGAGQSSRSRRRASNRYSSAGTSRSSRHNLDTRRRQVRCDSRVD